MLLKLFIFVTFISLNKSFMYICQGCQKDLSIFSDKGKTAHKRGCKAYKKYKQNIINSVTKEWLQHNYIEKDLSFSDLCKILNLDKHHVLEEKCKEFGIPIKTKEQRYNSKMRIQKIKDTSLERYGHEVGLHGTQKNVMIDNLKKKYEIDSNVQIDHPQLINFLQELKYRGIIANLTVNQGHLKKYQELLLTLINTNLIKGLGISITNNSNFNSIKPLLQVSNNIVYHLIAGVNPIEVVDKLIELGNCKILLLGYKRFGFGVYFYNESINDNLRSWYKYLPKVVGRCTISFDNLAIEQLKVKRLLTEEAWQKFYMGDDFCYTMYIDAVNQQYAPTSRSKIRTSFKESSLLDYFQQNKK